MIKKILKLFLKLIIIIIVVIIIAICLIMIGFKINNDIANRKYNNQKETFIENATTYLEQKYDIHISECTYYHKQRVEYHRPVIDGGYFYSTPEFGIFYTDNRTEIRCVNKNGIYSDDYELLNLYSLICQKLSQKLDIDVQYIKFNSNAEELFSIDTGDYYVEKNMGMYLEKETNRYNEDTINVFIENLYEYLEDFELCIYAKFDGELNNNDLGKISKNMEKYKEEYSINTLKLYIYNENLTIYEISKEQLIDRIIDDGEIYELYLDNEQLSKYLYTTIILDKLGCRIINR